MAPKRGRENGADAGGDRKKRSWHQSSARAGLPLGAQGFLISFISGRERQAAQEAESLLKEFYERLVPPPAAGGDAAGAKAAPKQPAKDFSSLIEDEVEDLKAETRAKGGPRLLQLHNTNIGGLMFIILSPQAGCTPAELLTCMAEEVERTQQNRCRVCLRFLPIEVVCAADMEEIRKASKKLCAAAFPEAGPALRFAVQYEHRASKALKRDDVIAAIADAVPKPPHSVNLNDPDRTIIAQLCKGQCALGIAAGYKRFAKFNMLELSQKEAKEAAAAEEAKVKAVEAAADAAEPGQPADAPAGGPQAASAAGPPQPSAAEPAAAAAAELPAAAGAAPPEAGAGQLPSAGGVPVPQQPKSGPVPEAAAVQPAQAGSVTVQTGVQADAVAAGAMQLEAPGG